MNFLMLSVGRRGELIKDFKESMEEGSCISATDNSPFAPALYFADKQYIVPKINSPDYINTIIGICKKDNIDAVTTFIDPEIVLLAHNRDLFSSIGVEVLAPYEESASVCFDKYKMATYLESNGVKTVKTWGSYWEVKEAIEREEVRLPVFVKPRTGSGSVGARTIIDTESLQSAFEQQPDLIAQELMEGNNCIDIDVDVYVDIISHKPVSIFSKQKISSTIGGANKAISFKDERLFQFICNALNYFNFCGPIDIDLFYKDGEYYLSEINPRFGGAYLHAYGAGVDFIKLIENNLKGVVNDCVIGNYEEGIVMMMYDSVVIGKQTGNKLLETNIDEQANNYFNTI